MKSIAKTLIPLTFAAAFSLAACNKDEAKTEASPTPPAAAEKVNAEDKPAGETEPKPTQAASTDTSFAAGMMKSYETCRALLAADKTEGISECASGILEAAKSAQGAAPESAQEHVLAMATAADALSKLKADDIEALRISFGELSKATVAMLTASPKAAKNYHLFECPMAKGYQRWAQPGAELENPYMGARMLTCGSEVHDHHADMKMETVGEHGHAH